MENGKCKHDMIILGKCPQCGKWIKNGKIDNNSKQNLQKLNNLGVE